MKTEMQFDKIEWEKGKIKKVTEKNEEISVRFSLMDIYSKSYDTLYAVFLYSI